MPPISSRVPRYRPQSDPADPDPTGIEEARRMSSYTVKRLRWLSTHPGENVGHPDWTAATSLYQNFSRLFEREPTQSDINKYVPFYLQDANLGNAYLEKAREEEKSKPEEIKKRAPEFGGQVTETFRQSLGRDPTSQELEHYGGMMATNDLDAYQLAQYLGVTEEATTRKNKAFRGGLSEELQGQGERYFSEKILPAIRQSFAAQGRSVDSSAYAAMLAKAAQDQNLQREQFLSNLSASQYQGNQAGARADYERLLDKYYGDQTYARQRSDYLSDAYLRRTQELQDYNFKKQTYEDFLRRHGKRSPNKGNKGIGALAGGILGAGLGIYFGRSPEAAGAGYGAGSGFGGGIGELFG